MKSTVTRSFRELFADAPPAIQKRGIEAYRRWQEDPAHPGLQFKPVSPNRPIWSARVGRDFQAVGLREADADGADSVMWFWFGPHDAYTRLLKSLR